eukprot:3620516-Lingulodinium_polyedra.AAC.1
MAEYPADAAGYDEDDFGDGEAYAAVVDREFEVSDPIEAAELDAIAFLSQTRGYCWDDVSAVAEYVQSTA